MEVVKKIYLSDNFRHSRSKCATRRAYDSFIQLNRRRIRCKIWKNNY